MAKGFALPVQVNKRGGARLLEGSPYTRQIIRAGLTPNLSRNPFQAGGGVEVGISERIIFANLEAGTRGSARRQITRFFVRLRAADIARLAPGSDGLKFDDADGELVANIRYVELEADRERDLTVNLKDALRSAPGNVGGTVG